MSDATSTEAYRHSFSSASRTATGHENLGAEIARAKAISSCSAANYVISTSRFSTSGLIRIPNSFTQDYLIPEEERFDVFKRNVTSREDLVLRKAIMRSGRMVSKGFFVKK